MPFRSEKQRRYLWAKHPEIARKWADKYKTNKDLPMYVNSEERKPADTEKRALEKLYTTSLPALKNMGKTVQNRPFAGVFAKTSSSSTQKVELPASEKPMAAGETEAKMHTSAKDACDENAAKSLMGKIAAVISQRILKEIEERKALEEARKAQYIPQNVNLRSYPVNSGPQIPPPMGMTPPPQQPAQPQPQQQAQNTMAPVGGGSSPMANPINSFGALSMDGNINGNAAFGTKNSPDSSKIAVAITKWAAASPTTPCSCGCGDTVATCKCSADCKCRKPGGSCYKQRGEKPAKPGEKDYPDAKSWKKVTGISKKQADNELYTPSEDVFTRAFKNFRTNYRGDADDAAHKIDSARFHVAGGTYNDSARPNADKLSPAVPYVIDAVYRAGQEKGDPTLLKNFNDVQHALKLTRTEADQIQKNLYDKINNLSTWTTNPRLWAGVGIGAGGVLGAYGLKKLYDRYRRPKQEKKSSTPAWQRAAGKNDEGGLNAKGRASYNRATGGNLKAPVTESNPKGKRAKRQNSFCSRMCGMKKHETGSKTKKDPDSRINKALRKWNCKCGSEKVAASPFGGQPMINAMLRQNKTDQTVNRAASLLSPAVLNALGKRIGLGVGPALSFGASLGHTGVGHGLTAQQKMLQQFQQSQAPK